MMHMIHLILTLKISWTTQERLPTIKVFMSLKTFNSFIIEIRNKSICFSSLHKKTRRKLQTSQDRIAGILSK